MAIELKHRTTADGTFSSQGAAEWNKDHIWSGLTAGQLLVPDSATSLTSYAGLTFDGTTLALAAGTLTTAVGPQTWTETRNAAGVTFPGLKYVITDTASAAGSLAMQILGEANGTTNLLSLSKGGRGIFGGQVSSRNSAAGFEFEDRSGSGGLWQWYATSNVARLYNGTADTISITADGAFRLGSTDTSLSRISAGVTGVGTGAAGSFAGRLKLTSAIAAGVAVASLNAAPTTGEVQSVTDALAPALGATVAAGGAAKALVWYNGANWTVIGI